MTPNPDPQGGESNMDEAKEITWVPVYVERAICDLLPETGYAREIARVAWAWDDEHPGHENSLFRWQNEAIRQRRDLIALQELIEQERGSSCQYCSDYGCQSCVSLAQPVPSAGSKPQCRRCGLEMEETARECKRGAYCSPDTKTESQPVADGGRVGV